MKHKLIKTENYLLVVDDSEINVGEWCYIPFLNSIKRRSKYFVDSWKKIIAHLPLNNSPILEGVPLLPPLEVEDVFNPIDGYDKEYLSTLMFDGKSFVSDVLLATSVGYNKAKEKYKYTEEDMIQAFAYGRTLEPFDSFEDFIQSLSQPKIPTHFKVELVQRNHLFVSPKIINGVMVGKYIYEGGDK